MKQNIILSSLLLSLFLHPIAWGMTIKEAKKLVKKAKTDFPLVVNEEVVEQLNVYLGTPARRASFKKTLERKEKFEAVLSDKAQDFNIPDELNAIPIVESGYQNLKSPGRVKSAGLWMFMPATARHYGMRVNKKMDERLNVAKQTAAAYKYLTGGKNVFNDWLLSILAYNIGENAVVSGIQKHQTRDAWTLARNSSRGDKDYLSKVMAAMIIMKNPEVLEN